MATDTVLMRREVTGGRLRWVAEVRGVRVEGRTRRDCAARVRYGADLWACVDGLPEGLRRVFDAMQRLGGTLREMAEVVEQVALPALRRMSQQVSDAVAAISYSEPYLVLEEVVDVDTERIAALQPLLEQTQATGKVMGAEAGWHAEEWTSTALASEEQQAESEGDRW